MTSKLITPALILRSHLSLIPKESQVLSAETISDAATILATAPFPVLSHTGTPTSTNDPTFTYANARALSLFQYPLEEFIGLPSRLSASAGTDRDVREVMMRNVAERGYSLGVTGVRVAKGGKEFRLVDAVVWNVMDEDGVSVIGQAAALVKVDGCPWYKEE
ncbi:MEKHLA-domain-containing protein [Rhizoclosmatium globosum]|uniref:MEKHLA-domain-containing protein n=1 Tax=Rhizoclosmatium globosum TaxID=329046 RepID=A0A1Y2B6N0_9FUNG|nr:hypothetical protein HDU79_003632 [Rhizoclosmatium sp. JEL0117]ORY30493.1 MEKHLA-domain-containing protein [Rhizoclosmatium globosum]|eukprot:ORY30493.1 MEKHLA-domain-containing protein [Rhizoclosmatium globosum]